MISAISSPCPRRSGRRSELARRRRPPDASAHAVHRLALVHDALEIETPGELGPRFAAGRRASRSPPGVSQLEQIPTLARSFTSSMAWRGSPRRLPHQRDRRLERGPSRHEEQPDRRVRRRIARRALPFSRRYRSAKFMSWSRRRRSPTPRAERLRRVRATSHGMSCTSNRTRARAHRGGPPRRGRSRHGRGGMASPEGLAAGLPRARGSMSPSYARSRQGSVRPRRT